MVRNIRVQDHANVFQIGRRKVGQHSGNGGAVHSLNELIVKTSHLNGGAGALHNLHNQVVLLHAINASAVQHNAVGLVDQITSIVRNRNDKSSAVGVVFSFLAVVNADLALQIVGVIVHSGSDVLQLAVLVVQVSPGHFHRDDSLRLIDGALVVAQRERGQVVHSVDRNGPFGGNVLRIGHHGKLLLVSLDGNGVLAKGVRARNTSRTLGGTATSSSANRSAVLGLHSEPSVYTSSKGEVLRNGQAHHFAGVVDLHLIDALALVGVLQVGGSRRHHLVQHYLVVLVNRTRGHPQGQLVAFLSLRGPALAELHGSALRVIRGGTALVHDGQSGRRVRLDNIQVGSAANHAHAVLLSAQRDLRSVIRHIGLERAVLCIDGKGVNVELCQIRQFCRSGSTERNHCDDQHESQEHRK